MSKQIKETVKKFKEKNGNNTFTQKDLLMYIVQRIDNLPCVEHMSLIQETKAILKTWTWVAGVLITVMLAVVGFSTLI